MKQGNQTNRNYFLICEAAQRLVTQISPSSHEIPITTTEPTSGSSNASKSTSTKSTSSIWSWTRSVLEYLDLVDDERPHTDPNQEALHDDYFQAHVRSSNVEQLEASVDDARMVRSQSSWNGSDPTVKTLQGNSANSEETHSSIIPPDEADIVSYVDTCACVMNMAKRTIQQANSPMHQEYSMSSPLPCSVTYSSSTTTNNNKTTNVLHGIILHRNSYNPFSFHSFCQKLLSTLSNNNNDISESFKENLIHNKASLDVVMHILVASGFALFSDDADAIILLPPCDSTTDILQRGILRKAYLASIQSSNVTTIPLSIPSIQINDMDIAIFKLTHACWILEQRIIQLSTSIDMTQKQALVEQKKNKNNTSLALIHMRKRKMLLEERDRLQGVWINMETGLQALQRAKNDVHVIQSYELLHSTMKQMEGSGLNIQHVQELMDSIRECTEEFNWIHQELGLVNTSSNSNSTDLDTDEWLEREFQALELECAKEKRKEKALVENKDMDLSQITSTDETTDSVLDEDKGKEIPMELMENVSTGNGTIEKKAETAVLLT